MVNNLGNIVGATAGIGIGLATLVVTIGAIGGVGRSISRIQRPRPRRRKVVRRRRR